MNTENLYNNIREFKPDDVNSYANRKTMERAIKKNLGEDFEDFLQYIVYTNDAGRLVPIFLGEEAVRKGIHFIFPVIAV